MGRYAGALLGTEKIFGRLQQQEQMGQKLGLAMLPEAMKQTRMTSMLGQMGAGAGTGMGARLKGFGPEGPSFEFPDESEIRFKVRKQAEANIIKTSTIWDPYKMTYQLDPGMNQETFRKKVNAEYKTLLKLYDMKPEVEEFQTVPGPAVDKSKWWLQSK